MCTAISYISEDHYFGRNLDLEYSLGENIIVTPRSYRFDLRHCSTLTKHYAMIGTGIVADGYPLYYEATNEVGLSAAGLNFDEYAVFGVGSGRDNIAVFEFIPWVLGQCETLEHARRLLKNINLTNEPFNEKYPVSPLHFIVSDKHGSLTVESTRQGITVRENPVGVLTNNPDFDYHMTHLADYMAVSPGLRENTIAPGIKLNDYSRGMGGIGLPGDMSSASRFVRGVFLRSALRCGNSEEERVSGFFRMLDNLAQLQGCVTLEDGRHERTVYSSCCNTDKGIYYYTTYHNRRINAIRMTEESKSGTQLTTFPLLWDNDINYIT